MQFRTPVHIDKPHFEIAPCEPILLVGSCFADNMGRRFREEGFPVVVNPYGVMYNPISILHTVQRTTMAPHTAMLTLGTNHVYVLNETGEVVDNCAKRPQRLFTERELSVDECADALSAIIELLAARQPEVNVVLTVSPIRYAKYGFHGSALSKATLLLAADRMVKAYPGRVNYFPAYEVLNDELRDYRFYAPDMLHPSPQAVDYLWQRFVEVYFSTAAKRCLEEGKPLKEALAHQPFHPESEAYKEFLHKTMLKIQAFSEKYPNFAFPMNK